jgi:hypothetical protein
MVRDLRSASAGQRVLVPGANPAPRGSTENDFILAAKIDRLPIKLKESG